MGSPSKFDRLPEPVRRWAISELRATGYGDLDRISREVSARSGILISRSALGRFSRHLRTIDRTRPDLRLSEKTQNAFVKLGMALAEAMQALRDDVAGHDQSQ